MAPYLSTPIEAGADFTKTIHHDTYPAIDPLKVNHSGHTILITGASKGVGLASAVSFAKAGASGIILLARSSCSSTISAITTACKDLEKPVPQILELKVDVTSWEDVKSAASAVEKQFGKLDVLINNAGYLSEFKKIGDSDINEYWRNYEVNIKGTYLPTKAFLPLLLSSPTKTIINLSSRGAHVLSPGGSGYQLTKFAILRFTEYLMVEYGEQGLLAYNIHPGGIKTDVASRLPEYVKKLLVDSPEMASDAICWLTGERREWLAGRYVSCNWDVEELVGRKREIVEGDKLKMRMGF